ncbi:MAG: nitronate monooxygenase [Thermodesulfobacteriota bacterium]|nr:nitronate monooxygenase [Thermodesulfobacteriota bacterium]
MNMKWKTRLTELLGVEYPIIEGAYAGFGDSRLAAPVSEAGGLGMITAGALKTPEKLREDIRRARSITDKPLAVNLSVGICPRIDEMREAAIEEGIPVVETAAYNASEHGRRLKEAGVTWIHKVATVEHAVAAARQGADAVVIVGLEGTGFKSIRQLPLSIAIPWAARQIDIPIIAAGGIASGRGLVASLALGAEGIYLGTAFMATKECPIPEKHKQRLIEALPTDPQIRDKALTPPDPEKVKKMMEKRGRMDQGQWLAQLERIMLKESETEVTAEMFETAEILKLGLGSLAVAFLHEVCSAGELIERIITEAEEVLSQGLLA